MALLLLTYDQTKDLHFCLVSRTNEPLGIRDENLLQSALAAPENGRLYEGDDVFDMAASYAYHISCNHPFIEGNKRTGAMSADVFLLINEYLFQPDPEEYADMILRLVVNKITKPDIADYYRVNSAPYSGIGDLPLLY